MENKRLYISYWLRRFLTEYMITVRNLSDNTRKSYRDSFKQLLSYASESLNTSIDRIKVEDIDEEYVKRFLLGIENNRKCSVNTRNQRLAAIRSFSKYISHNCPEFLEWSRLINNIPAKRERVQNSEGSITPLIYYLNKNQMSALLKCPNQHTEQGRRDYALLIFLYNTGARASEASSLTIGNVLQNGDGTFPQVLIYGKGGRKRNCPLWKATVDTIMPLIKGRSSVEHVFLNRYGKPITRFGIYEMVERYAKKLSEIMPSISKIRVSPHTIRHSTASHLLEAGVDINTIRAWLGHVSVNTTNIYAEVNAQMKADAIKTCEINKRSNSHKEWKEDKSIMKFLSNI